MIFPLSLSFLMIYLFRLWLLAKKMRVGVSKLYTSPGKTFSMTSYQFLFT